MSIYWEIEKRARNVPVTGPYGPVNFYLCTFHFYWIFILSIREVIRWYFLYCGVYNVWKVNSSDGKQRCSWSTYHNNQMTIVLSLLHVYPFYFKARRSRLDDSKTIMQSPFVLLCWQVLMTEWSKVCVTDCSQCSLVVLGTWESY